MLLRLMNAVELPGGNLSASVVFVCDSTPLDATTNAAGVFGSQTTPGTNA